MILEDNQSMCIMCVGVKDAVSVSKYSLTQMAQVVTQLAPARHRIGHNGR